MNYKKTILWLSICLGTISCDNKSKEKGEVEKIKFSNPILKGFYPDPSICKVNGEYFMINSTFAYFPGIPIFKSDDLVNWKQIGNALNRPEQFNLDSLGVSRGIFAPTISYHKEVFYIISTLIDGKGNFVIHSKNPADSWSNPIWLPEVSGIDPSLFFDDDGKSYVIYNSEPPNDESEYDGHRTIKMIELDLENLKTIGQPKVIINKGAKPVNKPIWIEGPHIYKRNGFYYLMAAEGGTSDQHSEVVFRSKTILGNYVSYEYNPILTQRTLDKNRKNPITSTGHADIIEDNFGNWWGVFLGCRPYDNQNHFNTGRETFMAPVKWDNDWPIFDLQGEVVKEEYEILVDESDALSANKNEFIDEFTDEKLGFDWLFLRTPKEKWYEISDGKLILNTRPETTSELVNPSFIGYRQKHLFGEVSTKLFFKRELENEKAGLVAFQNENHFYYLNISSKENKPIVQLLKSTENGAEEIAFKAIEKIDNISIKIEAKGKIYNFYYSLKDKDWVLLKENVDATFLSTKTAGGFVGTIYGMYTTSSGEKSTNKAIYHWFKNNDVN